MTTLAAPDELRLPDVGEGLTEAEVVTWHVAVGDTVAINDVVVEIETAKSVVELPSPLAGVVTAVLVEAGTTVPVGTPLLRIGSGQPVAEVEVEERPQVLVGTGPTEAPARQRRLGARRTAPAAPAAAARETRTPVRGVRRATAEAMVRSAFTAPHVTEWLSVDMTRSMDLVRRLRADRAWAGVRVTPLVVVARAFLLALRAHPAINASWDEAAGEVVVKHYVNLGIAAATPRGLLVPHVRDAHELDLRGLAEALATLVETARAGRTQPHEMTGGTATITNIGALGVDAGTPILNPGESAILAFGNVRQQPWVVDGQVVVREVTQLALSFDHRLVDGELGSRVLARTGALLTDPGLALLG